MNSTTNVTATADSLELAHRRLDRQMELTMERKKAMQEDLGHALADVVGWILPGCS
jgi:chaperonin cofactor prefoldin